MEIDKVIEFINGDGILDVIKFSGRVYYKLSRGYCGDSPCWMNDKIDISYTRDPVKDKYWACIFTEEEKDKLSVVLSQYRNRKFLEDKRDEREKFLFCIFGK